MAKDYLKVIEDELYNKELRETVTVTHSPQTSTEYPDAKLHQVVSFIKSGIRILACIVGVFGFIGWAFIGLALAEVVGVIEELV